MAVINPLVGARCTYPGYGPLLYAARNMASLAAFLLSDKESWSPPAPSNHESWAPGAYEERGIYNAVEKLWGRDRASPVNDIQRVHREDLHALVGHLTSAGLRPGCHCPRGGGAGGWGDGIPHYFYDCVASPHTRAELTGRLLILAAPVIFQVRP